MTKKKQNICKKGRILISLFLSLTLFLSISCGKNQKAKKNEMQETLSQYKYEVTKKIVQLVNDAVDLIQKKGSKAFPKFRQEDSKWYQDDTYVFVWGLDGMRYVYPRDPEGEGKNMLELKDIDGKPIGKIFVNIAKSSDGEGWIFYEWTKPGEDEPTWKATYIKNAVAPSGKKYLVGCGEYKINMEKEFVIQIVNEAAILVKKDKQKAFEMFNSPASKFNYLDTYVFVKDMQGNELVNPANPDLVGTNIYDIQGSKGNYFVKNEIETLKTQDTCWQEYYWHKPGEEKPSKKIAFVRRVKVDGDTLLVGSGYYPANYK